MSRRVFLASIASGLASACLPIRGFAADDTPGVTATELKIGNCAAYSGPASAYGIITKTEAAVFRMVNDQGVRPTIIRSGRCNSRGGQAIISNCSDPC